MLVGSMRISAFTRATVYLTLGLACLVVAAVWGVVVWHAIGGGLTLSMIGGALVATGFPLVFFCLYVWPDAHTAANAVYLRERLVNCVSANAPDGRAPQYGSSEPDPPRSTMRFIGLPAGLPVRRCWRRVQLSVGCKYRCGQRRAVPLLSGSRRSAPPASSCARAAAVEWGSYPCRDQPSLKWCARWPFC